MNPSADLEGGGDLYGHGFSASSLALDNGLEHAEGEADKKGEAGIFPAVVQLWSLLRYGDCLSVYRAVNMPRMPGCCVPCILPPAFFRLCSC